MSFTATVSAQERLEFFAQARQNAAALDGLDANMREMLRLVQAMYDFARLAYEAMLGWEPLLADGGDDERESRARTMKAGDFAGQYRAVMRYITDAMCGGDKERALEIAQTSSDWLAVHGLNGIPMFVSASPTTSKALYKNARIVDTEMARGASLAAEVRKAARETAQAKAASARR